QIFEHRHCAVRLVPRPAHEDNTFRLVALIVSPEIVRTEKQEYTAARLRTNTQLLLWSGCLGQQKMSFNRAPRFDDNPPLGLLRNERIFHQHEAELPDKEGQCFVVIANDE